MLGDEHKSFVFLKWRSPTEQLIEHNPNGIDISAGIASPALQPFRSHIVGGADW